MTTTESEVALRLARTQQQDRHAEVERLYREHSGAFLRVSHAITGDAESARDAVQEALTRALRGRTKAQRVANTEAWLWAIVVNTAKSVRRTAGVGSTATNETSESAPAEDTSAVRAAVAALPERQRHALFLRYYADLDYASIAEVLGIRRGTVSATLHQAQNALRQALTLEEAR
jgi:RNA polymerase sigma factor (sigma-70 family)